MHDQLEPHLAAHGRLTKDGADIEQADAAHFEQVLQQVGAFALDRGLVDAVEVHGIIGHQAVAPGDQLQAQLALAQAGFTGDQHAHAQDVHEHAMHGSAVGEMLGQEGAQHIDDKGGRLLGGEHRDVRALAHGQQLIGRALAIGQHQHRWLQGHDAGNAAAAVFGGGVGEVGDLALAQHLRPVGVDVVEVAHQVGAGAGAAHRHFVKAALGGPQARQPFPAQRGTELLEQHICAYDIGFHGAVLSKPERAATPPASVED